MNQNRNGIRNNGATQETLETTLQLLLIRLCFTFNLCSSNIRSNHEESNCSLSEQQEQHKHAFSKCTFLSIYWFVFGFFHSFEFTFLPTSHYGRRDWVRERERNASLSDWLSLQCPAHERTLDNNKHVCAWRVENSMLSDTHTHTYGILEDNRFGQGAQLHQEKAPTAQMHWSGWWSKHIDCNTLQAICIWQHETLLSLCLRLSDEKEHLHRIAAFEQNRRRTVIGSMFDRRVGRLHRIQCIANSNACVIGRQFLIILLLLLPMIQRCGSSSSNHGAFWI